MQTGTRSFIPKSGTVLFLWEVGMGLALQKGLLNWVPDSVVALLLVGPILFFIGVLTRRLNNRSMAAAFFVLAWGALGVVAWLIAFKPPAVVQVAAAESPATKPKGQSFIIDYRPGSCAFFTVDAPSSDKYLNNRKGLFVGDITVVNNTGGSTTLKEVVLAYDYPKEGRRDLFAIVWPTGKSRNGEPALLLQWGTDKMMLPDWRDIRPAIADNKEKVPGAIWRGSMTFVFEPDIQSLDDIVNPRLVARDYLGQQTERPISPVNMTDWRMRHDRFVQGLDDSIRWDNDPVMQSPASTPQKNIAEVGPKNVPPKSDRDFGEPPGNQTVQGTELQREISALYKGHTAVKVMELTEPYKGRLIEVHGRVDQVNSTPPSLYHVILRNTPDVGCICFFKLEWKERLLDLEQGSIVKIRGEFSPDQNGGIIVMRECELISTPP